MEMDTELILKSSASLLAEVEDELNKDDPDKTEANKLLKEAEIVCSRRINGN